MDDGTAREGRPEPAVTVVIPTFNRADTVLRCVRSALDQGGDVEVVVVDDGSTDDTVDVLTTLDDPRLVVLEGAHRGVGAARNEGIRNARGRWLLFLDSDDWLGPGHLASLLAAANGDREDQLPLTGHTHVEATTGAQSPEPPRDVHLPRQRLLYANVVGALSCVLMPARLVREIGGFDEELLAREDIDIHYRLSAHAAYVVVPGTDTCFITYGSGDRMSGHRRNKRIGFGQLYRKYRREMTFHNRLYASKLNLALGVQDRHLPTVLRFLPMGALAVIVRIKVPPDPVARP